MLSSAPEPDKINWEYLAIRLLVPIAFGIFIAHTARQAASHRAEERRNKRMELELASIDPYLALLPVDVRNDVKKTLAERLFGQPEPKAEKGETTGSVIDLVKTTAETVKTLAEVINKKP